MIKSKKVINVLFTSLIAMFVMISLPVNAYEIKSTDSDIKVDKFKPSTGMKVKHSSWAEKMENATARATKKKSSINDESGNNESEYKAQPFLPKNINKNSDKFRWF